MAIVVVVDIAHASEGIEFGLSPACAGSQEGGGEQ